MIQNLLGQLRKRRLNNKGMALIIAILAVTFIMYLAIEVTYDSTVEYTVNSNAINRIKAYYAAKSGLQIGLLRIKLYQQAKSQFGSQLGSNAALLEKIWSFPFAWPMQAIPGMNAVDADNVKKLMSESLMDSSFDIRIQEEGSKIDLSDLNSKSEKIRESTRRQFMNAFERKAESDKAFAEKYRSDDFNIVLNKIADWMSTKRTGIDGGDKRAGFALPPEEGSMPELPPNRPFRTLNELRMIPGMNEDFYALIAPISTIYGSRTINPNTATKEVLMSLDKGITEEIVSEIQKRQSSEDEKFTCSGKGAEMDFWQFVIDKGARLETSQLEEIPITCDTPYTFSVSSTGEYGKATRQINVLVTDLNQIASAISKMNQKKKSSETPQTDENKKNDPKVQEPLPKGPPRIVYWSEN